MVRTSDSRLSGLLIRTVRRYVRIVRMIRNFADKRTAAVFAGHTVRGLAHHIQRRVRAKLRVIDAARVLGDLRVPPGNRLKPLRGDRDGQHSIRVNDQWRICFRWSAGEAWEVEIADYH